MTLYLLGLGLCDEKDITLRGLELIKAADEVYLEYYTSLLQCDWQKLEALYGRKVIVADRQFIESGGEHIVKQAKDKEIVLLVVGDPMSATTHTQFLLDAHKHDVPIRIIHNASILTAIGDTGLELYKFGKTTSIVFSTKTYNAETYYDVIKQNKASGLHTLCLLDLSLSADVDQKLDNNTSDTEKKHAARESLTAQRRCMTVHEAIKQLLNIEEKRKEKVVTATTICVGCARLGSPGQVIYAGPAAELLNTDFGKPPHCVLIPGPLHFVEEEALSLWKK